MEKQLSAQALDFAPDLLAIQERPPARMPRAILYSVLALFSVLLLWASVAKLDVIASAAGKLVPQSYLKIVQPADAGILKEIRVKEGDRVEAGQVLMRMDAAFAQADTRILESELKQRALQLRRVDAELAGKPLVMGKSDDPALFRQIQAQYLAHEQAYQDALGEERAALGKAKEELMAAEQVRRKLQNVLPTYQAQEEAWTRLGKDGFAGRLMVMDKQRERIEKEQDLKAQAATVESLKASIAQSEKRLAQITSNSKQQLQNERVQAQAQLERVQQELAKQQHRNALTELKAPQAGVIKDIATHTVGTVVSPGTILMTLVPVNDPLQAEVMIKNEDIGFVHVGQPAVRDELLGLSVTDRDFVVVGSTPEEIAALGFKPADRRENIHGLPGFHGACPGLRSGFHPG